MAAACETISCTRGLLLQGCGGGMRQPPDFSPLLPPSLVHAAGEFPVPSQLWPWDASHQHRAPGRWYCPRDEPSLGHGVSSSRAEGAQPQPLIVPSCAGYHHNLLVLWLCQELLAWLRQSWDDIGKRWLLTQSGAVGSQEDRHKQHWVNRRILLMKPAEDPLGSWGL